MVAKPFSTLPATFARINREIVVGVNDFVRRVSKAADEAAVDSTPVDTGLARSNWIASLDQPSTAVVPAFAPGNKLGIGEQANASAAKAQAAQVIGTYDLRKNRSVHLVNNVPYIGILNDGGRNRAPHNMVEKAGQAALAEAKRSRVLKR